jgi:7-carboxy-7-deazaguanine synthase
MKNIKINEIFKTIQSEGTFAGTPSIFIRTQFCDVGCGWCDTKHTWEANPAHEVTNFDIKAAGSKNSNTWSAFTPYDLLCHCKLIAGSINHIVLTGGEPMAQPDLIEFLELATNYGFKVQIETSGTHYKKLPDDIWVTVSPKINMKREVDPRMLYAANEIKMPIGKESDIIELQKLIFTYSLENKTIYLQPLSTSEKATKLCIENCMERNWKLSIQTHKFINIP